MAAEAEVLWRARLAGAEATEALGELLGAALEAGTLLALDGELGTGKTTLVRGLARGLGVRDAVSSPTFTRMRALEGRLPLYHFDAWRAGGEELFAEGADFLAGDGVAVVEWAERVEGLLPHPRVALRLGHLAPGRRSVEALRPVAPPGAPGQRAAALEERLRAVLERARALPGLEAGPA